MAERTRRRDSNESVDGSNISSTKRQSILLLVFLICSFLMVQQYDLLMESSARSAFFRSNHDDGGDDPTNNVINESNDDCQQQQQHAARMYEYLSRYHYMKPLNSRNDLTQDFSMGCGSGPDYKDFFKLNINTRSRYDEDKIIYNTFFKNANAAAAVDDDDDDDDSTTHKEEAGSSRMTYVELGAFDGSRESNTMFFDKCLQWHGLLIEGQPHSYQGLLQHRPHAHKMSFAPSCPEGGNRTVEFAKAKFTNTGVSGFAKAYDNPKAHKIEVPCGPLGPVLEDIFPTIDRSNTTTTTNNSTSISNDTKGGGEGGKPTINFFSLDVEGAEFVVLETIDFQAVQIDVLMVEVQNNFCVDDSCLVRQQVRQKMVEVEGYQLYKNVVRASDIYVHPESPYQIK